MPSFGYADRPDEPYSSGVFVSLSHATDSTNPSAAPVNVSVPILSWTATSWAPLQVIRGSATALGRPHDQVLRNHSVGTISIVAVSGPALRTRMRMHRSSVAALA